MATPIRLTPSAHILSYSEITLTGFSPEKMAAQRRHHDKTLRQSRELSIRESLASMMRHKKLANVHAEFAAQSKTNDVTSGYLLYFFFLVSSCLHGRSVNCVGLFLSNILICIHSAQHLTDLKSSGLFT